MHFPKKAVFFSLTLVWAVSAAFNTAYAFENDYVRITLSTPSGQQYAFLVEHVNTPEKMALGLMYRKQLDKDKGMLFTFYPPRQVSFWMKNTYIPLDILYINNDKEVVRIYHNTVPLSEKTLPSDENIAYVLEINAGLAKSLHITEGSTLSIEK